MSATKSEATERICHDCKVFVPEDQLFHHMAPTWGLCDACEQKSRAGRAVQARQVDDFPHAGIACLVVLLCVLGGICFFIALPNTSGYPPNLAAAGAAAAAGILWFTLAAGLHLLRRILIAIETPKKSSA